MYFILSFMLNKLPLIYWILFNSHNRALQFVLSLLYVKLLSELVKEYVELGFKQKIRSNGYIIIIIFNS